MHCGGGVEEELLAISPPPEFQDIPAPPPPVFRDLSPFHRGQGEGCGITSVQQQKPDSHPQLLCDFADRISFDILNEAMVIATEEVLSHHHGGCNRNSSNVAPTGQLLSAPEFPFSSDSSDASDTDEENPVSTTTSWEYLSKASSWSDLRCHRSASPQNSRLHTSPRHQNYRSSRNKKPDNINSIFITSSSTNHNPVSFYNEKLSTAHQEPLVTKSTSFHMDTLFPLAPCTAKNSQDLSIKNVMEVAVTKSRNRSADDTSRTCYNVPFQCDIYSLPIDNILSHSDDSNRPIIAPKRSRCKGPSQNFRLTSTQDTTNGSLVTNDDHLAQSVSSLGSNMDDQSFTGGNQAKKNFGKPGITLESACSHLCAQSSDSEVLSSCEKNNNLDNIQQFELESSKRSFRPPRSRSVEISNSENSGICRQKVSSQNSNFPTENSSPIPEQNCAEKLEKRTLGHSILNLFKRNKPRNRREPLQSTPSTSEQPDGRDCTTATNIYRALPLPPETNEIPISEDIVDKPAPEARDFAASIEKVKDCGWYWGPLSSEAAEDLLRGEPDGSFIVRDSSDAHYIFSLTFKLNGLVRHVRIEHDQGNFSFGPLTRFKASTIVDFVEKAVAHSRSGRYLFFLHRRPVLGPMRVQLLHPYSRFRHPRSLQHMCRFVILKYVRRDLIHTLPLPRPLQDYLNTPHYYFEQHEPKNTSA